MYQPSAQELLARQEYGASVAFVPVILPAEAHTVLIDRIQATVTDRDAIRKVRQLP